MICVRGIVTKKEIGTQSIYPMKGGWIEVGILLSHQRRSADSAQSVERLYLNQYICWGNFIGTNQTSDVAVDMGRIITNMESGLLNQII